MRVRVRGEGGSVRVGGCGRGGRGTLAFGHFLHLLFPFPEGLHGFPNRRQELHRRVEVAAVGRVHLVRVRVRLRG